jgi:hypothetical protein
MRDPAAAALEQKPSNVEISEIKDKEYEEKQPSLRDAPLSSPVTRYGACL